MYNQNVLVVFITSIKTLKTNSLHYCNIRKTLDHVEKKIRYLLLFAIINFENIFKGNPGIIPDPSKKLNKCLKKKKKRKKKKKKIKLIFILLILQRN